MLRSFVATQAITTIFLVECTDYGWSVGIRDERLGLFATKRQALDDVKKRRARLAANGQRSTVSSQGAARPQPRLRHTFFADGTHPRYRGRPQSKRPRTGLQPGPLRIPGRRSRRVLSVRR